MVYPERALEDEGIGLLSLHERSELNWVISTAKDAVRPEHRELPFCVTAVMSRREPADEIPLALGDKSW